jgi:DNA-binding IclR family transcriptional regulator
MREEIYAYQPLTAMTPETITTPDRLEAELASTRTQGYAVDKQENETGAICVAVPIFDLDGTVEGAISVAGPVDRMSPATVETIAQTLRREVETCPRNGPNEV